ncbi:MAG: mevalonate kinase [Anaerolineae bacterium]
MTLARAAGKVIVFGEHAVVYGHPAVAVPVMQVQAQAEVEGAPAGKGITIVAEDLGRSWSLSQKAVSGSHEEALETIIAQTLAHIGVGLGQDLTINVRSTIPIARGLGSGAAISTAIVRALCKHYDKSLSSQEISDLVYEAEKIYHGTPSGVDNTVIAFEKPVYFIKGRDVEVFQVGRSFILAIADTGLSSFTKVVVDEVRRAWHKEPARYEKLFSAIGQLAQAGRQAIEKGDLEKMGRLMDENQALLEALGVSCPELDRLIQAARESGALGAKLSGAGRGGNIIALVTPEARGRADMMLRKAGARDVIITEVR